MTRIPIMIDGGTLTGHALWKPGQAKPTAGLAKMPSIEGGIGKGAYMNAFADWFMPYCQMQGVTEAGIEAPIISDHGGQGVNIHEVDKNFAIVHAVEAACDRLGIRCERIARSTVCKHIAGVGKGTTKQLKNYCMVGCQRRGWNVTDHNVADALATLDYYVFKERIEVPWNCQPAPGPLFEGLPGTRIEKSNVKAAERLINKAISFTARDK